MKPFIYSIIFSLTTSVAFCQIVNIPDANFKNYLLSNLSINTNSDGEIQVAEATAFTGIINVNQLNITDLAGIEAFTAITSLYCNTNNLTSIDVSLNLALEVLDCGNNQLTTINLGSNTALSILECSDNLLANLNVSANTGLTFITCNNNQLTNLDVTNNTSLDHLGCGGNQLPSLNLSQNVNLTGLGCYNNQLTTLDISANIILEGVSCFGNELTVLDASLNPALTDFVCDSNELTSLDLSVNTNLTFISCRSNLLTNLNVKNGNNVDFQLFWANDNPDLTCIQVDDADFSETNWTGSFFSFDNAVNFNEDCSIGIAEENNRLFRLYPNPINDKLKIFSEEGVTIYTVYESSGKNLIQQISNSEKLFEIDLSLLSPGIYFIRLQTKKGLATKKFVKE